MVIDVNDASDSAPVCGRSGLPHQGSFLDDKCLSWHGILGHHHFKCWRLAKTCKTVRYWERPFFTIRVDSWPSPAHKYTRSTQFPKRQQGEYLKNIECYKLDIATFIILKATVYDTYGIVNTHHYGPVWQIVLQEMKNNCIFGTIHKTTNSFRLTIQWP